MADNKRTCTVDGCDRPSRKRGWCSAHYGRWWTTGTVPTTPLRVWTEQDGCAVDGCQREARTNALCKMHYTRQRTHGNPLIRKHVHGTVAERLDAYTDRSGGSDACHIWTGYKDVEGYGRFSVGNRKIKAAHRVAYELAEGQIPHGMSIDHICRNTSCVNPAHLRACTHKQNLENLSATGWGSSGVRGVSRVKKTGRWLAYVTHNRRRYNLGRFATIEEAEAAVVAKRLEMFTHNDTDRS